MKGLIATAAATLILDCAGAQHVLQVDPAVQPVSALMFQLKPASFEEEPGNAAPLYLQAVVALGGFTDDERLAAIPPTSIDEIDIKSAEALLAPVWETIAPTLKRAATRDRCDWETPIKVEGMGTLLPELGKLREVAHLIAARARLHIAQDQIEDAVETLKLGFELADDLDEGPTLLQALVGTAIAGLMLEQLELLVSRPNAPSLYWALTDLPVPLVSLDRALRHERHLLDFEIPELEAIASGAMPPEEAVQITRSLAGRMQGLGPGDGFAATMMSVGVTMSLYPKGRSHLRSLGYTREEIEAMPTSYVSMRYSLHRYSYWRDELFKWFALPYWQAAPGLARTQEALEEAIAAGEANPFLMLLPAVSRASLSHALLQRRIALLRTVEAIRLHAGENGEHLPANLDAIKIVPVPNDPVTGGAFDYRLEGGVARLLASVPPGGDAHHATEYQITINGE